MTDNAQVKAIAEAWMRHIGYTDEQIEAAESETHHGAGCELTGDGGWACFDEAGDSLHPEWDDLIEACEFANVALETLEALKIVITIQERRCAACGQLGHNCPTGGRLLR